jgi:hypothetical protein
VKLPGFKAETFQQIVQWLYQSRVIVDPPSTPVQTVRMNSESIGPADNSGRRIFRTPEEGLAIQRQEISRQKNHFLFENYFELLRLADYIDLKGPFHDVFDKIADCISRDYQSLSANHIETTIALPDPARKVLKVIAFSLAMPYIYHTTENIRHSGKESRNPFKFQTKIDDSDVFAAELLKAVGDALQEVSLILFRN